MVSIFGLAVSLAVISVSFQTMTPQEQSICLSAHNKLRALHKDTSSFTWDPKLAAESQKWADHLAKLGRLTHDMNSGSGENLFWSQSFRSASKGDSSAKAALSWYEEIKAYDYRTHESNGRGIIGHLTQLVWKESTKLGCGMAVVRKNGRFETYVVSRYSPRGNSIRRNWGESSTQARIRVYSKNVQPRKAGAVTPSLAELERGGSTIPTGGPTPPPPSTNQPTQPPRCANKRGDGYCNHVLRCGRRYLCNGSYSKYFMEDCFKSCTYC